MTGVTVKIAPEILNWIIQKVQLENIGDSVCDVLNQWRSGEKIPTFNQIEDISKKINIPFGYFFLETPPQETCSIVEYRTVDSVRLQEPSRNLIDVLDTMTNIQQWMREYLKDNGYNPLDFVGKYRGKTDVLAIVEDIRSKLGLREDWFTGVKSAADSFRHLRRVYEAAGILVMMSGTVGSNTHRKLNVAEFRAFTLIDEYAPLIFINTNDSDAGKVFSLLHELIHIWLGVDSFFNGQDQDPERAKPIERICNAVAAELLAPDNLFITKWRENCLTGMEKMTELSMYFRCSKSVIARKALNNGYISKKQYDITIDEINRQYRIWREEQSKKKASGGDYYKTLGSKMDHRVIRAMESSAKEGKTPYTEVYRLTNTNRKTFTKLVNEIGGVK